MRTTPQGDPSHSAPGMTAPAVTVWFDGSCPLCTREIALMRPLGGLAGWPGFDRLFEGACRGFLRVRPRVQAALR